MHLNDKKVPKLVENLIIFSWCGMTSLNFYQISHLKFYFGNCCYWFVVYC